MDAYQVCLHFLPFLCCCLYIQFSNLFSFNGFSMIFVRLSLVFLSTYSRLPFKRILDWDKFSLRIERNDTYELHNLVHRIKASDSFTLHSNLLKVKNIILTLIRLTCKFLLHLHSFVPLKKFLAWHDCLCHALILTLSLLIRLC